MYAIRSRSISAQSSQHQGADMSESHAEMIFLQSESDLSGSSGQSDGSGDSQEGYEEEEVVSITSDEGPGLTREDRQGDVGALLPIPIHTSQLAHRVRFGQRFRILPPRFVEPMGSLYERCQLLCNQECCATAGRGHRCVMRRGHHVAALDRIRGVAAKFKKPAMHQDLWTWSDEEITYVRHTGCACHCEQYRQFAAHREMRRRQNRREEIMLYTSLRLLARNGNSQPGHNIYLIIGLVAAWFCTIRYDPYTGHNQVG